MRNLEQFRKKIRMAALCQVAILTMVTGCGIEDKALTIPLGEYQETALEAGAGMQGTDAQGTGAGVPENRSTENRSTDIPGTGNQEAEQRLICVHVCGQVTNPGVYSLPEGSRAGDALEAAGGFAAEAAEDYVNLAAKVADGEKLYFPHKEEAQTLQQEQEDALSGIVNINLADEELLCTLPGIGEARAKDIINYRQTYGAFEKPEDIMKVNGIKSSAYEKLKDKIRVEN